VRQRNRPLRLLPQSPLPGPSDEGRDRLRERPFGRLAPLQRGVRVEDRRIANVCESELFPEHAPRHAAGAARDPEGLIRDLREWPRARQTTCMIEELYW
jgi:hypothetical protein